MTAKDQASSVLKNIGVVAIGLGTAFLAGAALAVKAAADEEQGIARLRQALDNVAHESMPDIMDAWEGAIQEMEGFTAFSDGEMRDALSMLASLTGSADEAWRRLPIAMDLARGAGIDLNSASKLLGKTSDENTTALSRLGIKLGENATATDVLLAVQEKFGGQSAAYAATAVGQWQILQNNIGDFIEDIGAKLLPMVTTGIGIIGELFGVISGQAPDAGGKLREAVGGPMAETIMGALAAVRDTAQLIFAGDFPALINRVVAFVGEALPRLRDQLLKWAGEFIAWVGPQIPILLGELTKLLGQALNWLNEHGEEIGRALVEWGLKFGEFIFEVALPELNKNMPKIEEAIIAFALTMPGKIQGSFNAVGRGIVSAIGDAVRDAWNDIADAFHYMLTQAIHSIDFWVGPFHISGVSGISVSFPQIQLPSFVLPSFQSGGIVPGPIGAPQMVIAHGGEQVLTRGQQSGGGGGVTLVFNAPVYGMQDFEDQITRIVRDKRLAGGFRGVL